MIAAARSEPVRLDYIDALRGYAFLMVLLAHTESVVGSFGDHRSVDFAGQYGVQLFFLVSALTLCKSAEVRGRVERFPNLFFYLRRLFRIAPLFWCAMAFYWSVRGALPNLWLESFGPPGGVTASYFVLTALFLHGWTPYTFNSIVPGGWSIAVEMNFYLIFPMLYFLLRTFRRTFLALMFATALAGLQAIFSTGYDLYGEVDPLALDFFISHGFPAELGVFLIGFLLYHLLRRGPVVLDRFWSNCLVWIGVTVLVSLSRGETQFVPIAVFNSLGLAAIVYSFAGGRLTWLVNPAACYLGKISYSCYLVHFIALTLVLRAYGVVLTPHHPKFETWNNGLNLLHFVEIGAAALVLTAIFATATFWLIETPGIALGRRLIRAIGRVREPAAAAEEEEKPSSPRPTIAT